MQTTKKPSPISRALAPLLMVFQAVASYTMAYAQAPNVKVDITTDGHRGAGAFYQTWWFWVLIGLFALIVIIAITQRGKTVVK